MIEKDFQARSRDAIEQMKQMNSRSTNKQSEQEHNNPESHKNQSSLFGNFGLPFLDKLKSDGDLTLILGILLLLLSEKADKRLLFALIYILL